MRVTAERIMEKRRNEENEEKEEEEEAEMFLYVLPLPMNKPSQANISKIPTPSHPPFSLFSHIFQHHSICTHIFAVIYIDRAIAKETRRIETHSMFQMEFR